MFKKIALIDCGKISLTGIKKLKELSQELPVELPHPPSSPEELGHLLKDCDALITSLTVDVTEAVIRGNPQLKYIGVCGSSLKRINQEFAVANGVTVKNVLGYCDNDTAHFLIIELCCLVRGLKNHLWRDEPQSLCGKTLGIIGLGAVGLEVAKLANAFGMHVIYYSRSRKPDFENSNLVYKNLDNVLGECDFLSLHTPPKKKILEASHFQLLGTGKILLNTCVGEIFNINDLQGWLENGNFSIFDSVAASFYPSEIKNFNNMIISDRPAYKTKESYEGLAKKVVEAAQSFLQ